MARPLGLIFAKACFILRASSSFSCHERNPAPRRRPSGVIRFSAPAVFLLFLASNDHAAKARREALCRRPRTTGDSVQRHQHHDFTGANRGRIGSELMESAIEVETQRAKLLVELAVPDGAGWCRLVPVGGERKEDQTEVMMHQQGTTVEMLLSRVLHVCMCERQARVRVSVRTRTPGAAFGRSASLGGVPKPDWEARRHHRAHRGRHSQAARACQRPAPAPRELEWRPRPRRARRSTSTTSTRR